MITADALIAQARQWKGVRFRHQGRTRFGCDCLGFIAGLQAELGSDVAMSYLPVNYARAPQSELISTLEQVAREIQLQPAALLMIQFPFGKYPSHAAIYTGESLIHCTEAEGKVVEHGYQEPWIHRTMSVWALPEVQYRMEGDALAI